jgi:hypothetical protein
MNNEILRIYIYIKILCSNNLSLYVYLNDGP